MTHTIQIDWEVVDKIDNHGGGYWSVALEGEDQYGDKYIATGYTMFGELEEIEDIEKIESEN